MSRKRLPTLEDIDELISFLPQLYADGFEPVKEWMGGQQRDGTFEFPYPIYDEIVTAFFGAAGKECWCDHEYVPKVAAEMLADDKFIQNCNLLEMRTMLTFCVRRERFGDGNWAAFIQNGNIRSLLNRLMVLKEQAFGT